MVFGDLNDFPIKGLPPSAAMPAGNPDQVAMILAWKISRGGDGCLPSLLTALQSAGFTIMDENRKVLRASLGGGTGTGLVIFDWEAVGMLTLAQRGIGITLDKLTASIVQNAKQFPSSKLSDLADERLGWPAHDGNCPVAA